MIFLGPNKTETTFVIVFTPNIVELICLGLEEAIQTSTILVKINWDTGKFLCFRHVS